MRGIFLLLLITIIYNVSAQNIKPAGLVPLEEYSNYKTDNNLKLSDVSYFKDVNNHLDKYVGTWIGGYDSNTLELEISILENQMNYRISYDKLLIKYKITDPNGNEIVNTIPFFDSYKYHISGKYFPDDNTSYYIASYIGYESACNQKGRAIMHTVNSNTLTFWILPDNDMIGPECPLDNIHILPTTLETLVTLTKQN
jgi:hypothetical protein